MDIGGKIKCYRILKNFSPEQVAERLDISSKTYRKYETNESAPNINMLEKIAEVLEKSIFDLLPENIVQKNENQGGGAAFNFAFNPIINQLSEKVIEQYEKRIQELKEQIIYWKQKSENT